MVVAVVIVLRDAGLYALLIAWRITGNHNIETAIHYCRVVQVLLSGDAAVIRRRPHSGGWLFLLW